MKTLFEQTQQEVLQNRSLKMAKVSSFVEISGQLFLESHQLQDNLLGGSSAQKMQSIETSIEILHANVSQEQELKY